MSKEVGCRKPGTLDVLARAQRGLETFSVSQQERAFENTIRALPHIEDQKQAREFTRAFMPLLSNWLKNPTDNKNIDNVDRDKEQRLRNFFEVVNELDGSIDRSDAEQLRNVRGIQHAFYTALPPQTFEVLDAALPPAAVYKLTRELKEIGDVLLGSRVLANIPMVEREDITKKRDDAERYQKKARGRASIAHPRLEDDDAILLSAQPARASRLRPKVPSQTAQAPPIRTRTRRKVFGWLPGKFGTTYAPAFSLSAPALPTRQDQRQRSAPPGFREFVVKGGSGEPEPKNVRVKAQTKHDPPGRGCAFTLTDSDGAKLDIYTDAKRDGELEKRLLRCSESPAKYWRFRGQADGSWREHPSKFVPQSAASKVLQKILLRADYRDDRQGRGNGQGRK